MCDRFLTDSGLIGAAAPAVAAITDEARGDALRRHKAGHNGEITADDGMGMELFAQAALGSHRAREDDESARFLVKSMDDPQTRQRPFANAPFAPRNELCHEIIQGRRERSAAFVPVALRWMADGGNAGRLLDHDKMLVEMADDDGFFMARLRCGTGEQFDGLAFLEPPRRIETQFAVNASTARGDEPPHLIPGLSRQTLAQHCCERQVGLFGGENNRIKGFVHVALFESISFLPVASPYLLQLGRIHWQGLREIASLRFTLPFDMNESTLHSDDPGRASAITATLFFKEALLKTGWASDVRIGLAGDVIASVETGVQLAVGDERHDIGLPGMPNLHSHAFQRAMAGLVEVRGPDHDTFWTWREIMYRLALAITPEDMQAVAALLYAEMLEAGFTRIGEFHYLHHDCSGASYCDPAEMAGRIVAAAGETGIELTLLPVFYAHGGFGGKPPNDSQRRFLCDPEGFARLVEASRQRAAVHPHTVVGIAPHSLRAITPDELAVILPLAPDGPIHIHVAEQVREVEDCLSWSGCRPVEWLLDNAAPDGRWCFIHTTHVTTEESKRLAVAGVVAGFCPITEANLGDGICNGPLFFALGGRFGIGSDSNVLVSVADELRQLEYAQRLLARQRNLMALCPGVSSGRTLYEAAVQGGAVALGAAPPVLAPGAPADIVSLDGENTALLEKHGDRILDGWIFTARSSPVDCVWVGGRKRVEDGRHLARQSLVDRYRKSIARLLADL